MAAAEADLVIAGGGPAGLAAAILARQTGLDVVLLEAGRPPVDAACGEGIMPDGVEVLEQMGVGLEDLPSRPFQGVRYVDGDRVAEGRFPARAGLGVRRTALHQALSRRAEAVGVRLHWGTRVTALEADGFVTDGHTFRGRWLVGADGRASRVRRWARLDAGTGARRRFGVRRHYRIEPWTELVEVHWQDHCEAYITPVDHDLVGVAMLWSGDSARFDGLLARFPELERRLAGAEVASRDRGAGPLEQRSRGVVAGRLALVGDAAGYLDAITGEGLSIAFQGAAALARAITEGDLGLYERACRRITHYPRAVIRLLLAVEERPWLRRRMMAALASNDTLLSRFLELKMRSGGPRLLGRDGLLRLTGETLLAGF